MISALYHRAHRRASPRRRSSLTLAAVLLACGACGRKPPDADVVVGRGDQAATARPALDASRDVPGEWKVYRYLDPDLLKARVAPTTVASALDRLMAVVEEQMRDGKVPQIPMGVFVAIRPPKETDVWIQVFHEHPDDHLEPGQMDEMKARTESIAELEVRHGPILYGALFVPDASRAGYRDMPVPWTEAMDRVDKRLPLADALTQVLYPDPDEPGWKGARSDKGRFRVTMPAQVHGG